MQPFSLLLVLFVPRLLFQDNMVFDLINTFQHTLNWLLQNLYFQRDTVVNVPLTTVM